MPRPQALARPSSRAAPPRRGTSPMWKRCGMPFP